MKTNKKKQNYIDNDKFYNVMVEYKTKVREYEANGSVGDPPKIPNYIGECIYLIATRLSTKPSFVGYSYREEFVGDAIENCIKYLNNFNEQKYNKPFAYFTMICWRAFLRRIWLEKKQQYVRYKLIEKQSLTNDMVEMSDDEFHNVVASQIDNSDHVNKLIQEFEGKLQPATKSKKEEVRGIEEFAD